MIWQSVAKKMSLLVSFVVLILGITACGTSSVQAESRVVPDRLFLDLSLEYVGSVDLPKTTYQETPVGGLSGISYDRKRDRIYALSDDRSRLAPARFYTLQLTLDPQPDVKIENVTFLKNGQGNLYEANTLDPEAIALSPRDSLYISSEGIPSAEIPPFIAEFDRETGQKRSEVPLPKRFIPQESVRNDDPPHGVQENLGFEALTLAITSLAPDDPFRLFSAPEYALVQDNIEPTPDTQPRLRMLHYVINPIGPAVLLSENLYLLDPPPDLAVSHGLTELVSWEKEGYLLSLERSYSPTTGIHAKIFQVVSGNATDTSRIDNLKSINIVQPMQKQLLLDLNTLDIPLDNLEGMTFGPHFPDGSQSLILVSDDNFSEEQKTQFLVFRLQE